MSVESTLVTYLTTLDDLTDILTGGIYSAQALGSKGLTAGNAACEDAFETVNGMSILLPCLVVRVRQDAPDYERYDGYTQETSWQGTAELWFYQDRGHDTLNSASEEAYAALHAKSLAGIGYVRRAQTGIEGTFAPEFQNVSLRRDDYLFKRVKRI